MSNVIPTQSELAAMHEIVDTLLKSNLYRQKKGENYVNLSHEEAFAKVLFGWEIGIGAAQSMSAINIMQGKLSMSSALMTGLMTRAGYNWKSLVHDDNECTLLIRNADKEELGTVTFTYKQAQDAGLPNKNANWKTYRQDMLFARAISAAARRYASAVFGGNSVYTPEELGGDDKQTHTVVTTPAAQELSAEDNSILELEKAVSEEVSSIRVALSNLTDDKEGQLQYLKSALKNFDEAIGEEVAEFDGKAMLEFLKSEFELEDLQAIHQIVNEMIEVYVQEAPKATPVKKQKKA